MRITTTKFIIGALILWCNVTNLQAADCLVDALPIGEKDLLEPESRWTSMTSMSDSLRTSFLTAAGYADSTGSLPSGLVTKVINRCPYTYGGAEGIELLVIYVKGREGDKDENIYLATVQRGSVLGRTLIAQLQTTCTTTFLRGCKMLSDGTIHIQQLEHQFECGTDEFKGTQILPSFTVAMRDDGLFEETLITNETSNE